MKKKTAWPTDPIWEFRGNYNLQDFFSAIVLLAAENVHCYLEEASEPLEFDEKLHITDAPDLSYGQFVPCGDHYRLDERFAEQLMAQTAGVDLIGQVIVYDDHVLLDASDPPFHPFYVSRRVDESTRAKMAEILGIEGELTHDVYGTEPVVP